MVENTIYFYQRFIQILIKYRSCKFYLQFCLIKIISYIIKTRLHTMQSSSPPNLLDLNQFFVQHDSDHDGQIDDQQIALIFKQIGYNDVYIGTIKQVIRLLNLNCPEKTTLNYSQLEQFASAMATKGKFKVWKYKYQLKESMMDLHKEFFSDQQNQQDSAAPGGPTSGAGGPSQHNQSNYVNSQQGLISLNIGEDNMYDHYVNFTLDKEKGKQSFYLLNQLVKPFIKISIQRQSQEQAEQLQTIFKQIYDTFIQIIKAEEQQLISQILSISFITTVNGNIFNLFITTSNQSLIQTAQLLVDYLDLLLKQPINGNVQASYKFNFDFEKFISDPQENFYGMFVKNCSVLVKWNVWDLFKNLRKVLLKTGPFKDLQWDSTSQASLFLMLLIHCQKFTGKMQFQNTSTQNQQTKSKQQLNEIFKGIKQNLVQLQKDTGLRLINFIQHLDGRIAIEAGIRDWRLNFDVKMSNFSKLFIPNNGQDNKNSQSGKYQENDEKLDNIQSDSVPIGIQNHNLDEANSSEEVGEKSLKGTEKFTQVQQSQNNNENQEVHSQLSLESSESN